MLQCNRLLNSKLRPCQRCLSDRRQDFAANRRQSRYPVHAVVGLRPRGAGSRRGGVERLRRRRRTGRRADGDHTGCDAGRRPGRHHGRRRGLRLRAGGRAAARSRHHRHQVRPRRRRENSAERKREAERMRNEKRHREPGVVVTADVCSTVYRTVWSTAVDRRRLSIPTRDELGAFSGSSR